MKTNAKAGKKKTRTVFGIPTDPEPVIQVEKKVDAPAADYLPAPPFVVRVLVDEIAVRIDGTADAEKTGVLKKGSYTICEAKNGTWGKLKSGVGWISLANPTWVEVRS